MLIAEKSGRARVGWVRENVSMRNLIANALSLVLLWAFLGPAALVAASGQGAHACCHRAHHPKSAHDAQFQAPSPSHECCRLLFASHLPRVASPPLTFAPHTALAFAPEGTREHYVELQSDSHPERAPPYSWFSL